MKRFSILFALFGLLGFKSLNGDPLQLLYFSFFGQLSNLWWNKLDECEDKQFLYNKYKAAFISFSTCIILGTILSVLIRLFSLDVLAVYRLQVLIISLAIAIGMNLWAFLTYKFNLG